MGMKAAGTKRIWCFSTFEPAQEVLKENPFYSSVRKEKMWRFLFLYLFIYLFVIVLRVLLCDCASSYQRLDKQIDAKRSENHQICRFCIWLKAELDKTAAFKWKQ